MSFAYSKFNSIGLTSLMSQGTSPFRFQIPSRLHNVLWSHNLLFKHFHWIRWLSYNQNYGYFILCRIYLWLLKMGRKESYQKSKVCFPIVFHTWSVGYVNEYLKFLWWSFYDEKLHLLYVFAFLIDRPSSLDDLECAIKWEVWTLSHATCEPTIGT